ncbi:MAG: hypothetical protein ABR567_02375 [Myxococcales bacterium]|nr:hypothetical protein [Myxococcales bacterium]
MPTLILALLFATSAIPMMGLGDLRRAVPQSPCASGPSRQFDFWVGDWAVYNKFGVAVAENDITVELDGCAVEEHYTFRGTHGRSLNAWDAATGAWHQTWVTGAPPPAYPLRMSGGLRPDGVMAMSGVRHSWDAPDDPAADWRDAYTWTAEPDASVVQAFTLDIDRFNVHSAGALTYLHTAPPPPVDAPPVAKCITGNSSDTRRLDFTLGNWSVQASNGLPLASTSIALDPALSSCLLEETFVTPQGYRATGWLYYDPVEDRFFRTIADSEGGWLEVGGRFDATGALVLEGARPVPGADDARVRITWTAVSPNRQEQLWQISRDGGQTWRDEQVLVLTR